MIWAARHAASSSRPSMRGGASTRTADAERGAGSCAAATAERARAQKKGTLPEQLAADPQFRERFDREARTISQLDHPHICALYDVGEQQGLSFLVMQYLEGETLAARLHKGALPLPEALTLAIQIASALDAAHRAGITHRDLKPGTVMLTRAGAARPGSSQAKLLDFGLAKTRTSAVAGSNLSTRLPTAAADLTARGTILGTFQYMAPEQIEGQEADARTDLFAFGVVLYEMLTGKRASEGKTPASLFGAILKDDPPPIAPASRSRHPRSIAWSRNVSRKIATNGGKPRRISATSCSGSPETPPRGPATIGEWKHRHLVARNWARCVHSFDVRPRE